MKPLLSMTLTVLRLYLRDPLTVVLSLVLIVFMMVLFGLVMGDEQFQVELPVAVWDQAETDASRALLADLADDDLLTLEQVESQDAIDEQIRRARVIAGLVIEPGYGLSEDGLSKDSDSLRVAVDDQSTRWIRLGLERLATIVRGDAASAAELEDDPGAGRPWRTEVRSIDVVQNRYIDFIFPGILAMAIMQTCLMSGVVILQAKQMGIIRRMQLTPVRLSELLGGFVLGRLLVVLLHLVVLTAVAMLGFGAEILASWWELLIAGTLGVVLFLALGLLVALMAPSLESGSLLSQALSLPMTFLCGVFFSVDGIPAALQWVPAALPLTYLVDVFRGLINLGLPLSEFLPELGILGAWIVGVAVACRFAYQRWSGDAQ